MRALWVAAAVLIARPATADEKRVCIAAYEQVQTLRREGDVLAARAQVAACLAQCPDSLASDCRNWQADIEAAIASIVVEGVDASGRRLRGVRVSLDGSALSVVTSKPIEVDPGKHMVSFVAPDGRVVERQLRVAPVALSAEP